MLNYLLKVTSHQIYCFVYFVQEVIKVVQPIFLGKIIQYFESYDPADTAGFYSSLGYAAGLSCCSLSLAIIRHIYFFHVQRVGMKVRVAMCHMIYKKVCEAFSKFYKGYCIYSSK